MKEASKLDCMNKLCDLLSYTYPQWRSTGWDPELGAPSFNEDESGRSKGPINIDECVERTKVQWEALGGDAILGTC